VLQEVEKVFTEKGYSKKIKTMTLEASTVRLSDIIAYIGRDIEDAIIVGVIEREDIPEEITKILGKTNREIVNTLIMDVIVNSLDKPYLEFSKKVFKSLIKLKEWNYEKIYASKEAVKNLDIIENAFYELYNLYINKVNGRKSIELEGSISYSEKCLYEFINSRSNEYKEKTDIKRIIIDYIAGQTDKFFIKECEANIKNFKLQ